MNAKTKKLLIYISLLVTFCTLLTGCTPKVEKRYQQYVKALISLNYLGVSEDYLAATGSSEADAQALYEKNIDYLTDNLLAYYQVRVDNAPEIREQYRELAKHIYSKINFSVSKAYKYGSVYLVDITIYPIDLFNQTAPEVSAYIEKFNEDVANGVYNDYDIAQYETAFSTGLLDILNKGCDQMTYADPIQLTAEIVEEGKTYYLTERDLLDIDACMFSTVITQTEDSGTDTTDSTEEGE